jgi:hypothetical protein
VYEDLRRSARSLIETKGTTMDLKTFVAETLNQVMEGIVEAQKSKFHGGAVNAESGGLGGGNLISAGTYGIFTRIDFDVAVSAETTGGGKGSISVFGVGAEGGAERKSGYANRITFSVPVRLPDGDRKVGGNRFNRQLYADEE